MTRLLSLILCATIAHAAEYSITLPAPLNTGDVVHMTVQGQAPAPAPVSPVATIPMGVNLPGMDDWNAGARAKIFVDVMKTARCIQGAVGADGWPTGASKWRVLTTSNNQEQSLNWATSGSRQPKIAGVYALSWTGSAAVTCAGGTLKNVTASTADLEILSNAVDVDLNFSAPVKNIVLLRPGYALGTTQFVTNEWKTYLQQAGIRWIRVMDATGSNIADAADWAERQKTVGADGKMDWAERPSDTYATYNRPYGMSFEAAVRIANECKVNVWYPLPYGFTDDFAAGLANYSKANMDPSLILTLEPMNETWNYAYGFYQSGLFRTDAAAYAAAGTAPKLANPPDNDYYYSARYSAKRMADVSNIFRSVYGSEYGARIRTVLASQFANPSFIADALNWMLRSYPNPPSYYLSGIACAPYIGASTGTVDQLVSALQADIATRSAADSKLMWWRAMADQNQLKLYMYEAGVDVGQGTTNITNRIALGYDTKMEGVTKSYLESCYFDAGADSLMWFNAVCTRDKWGIWGLTDDAADLAQPMYLGAKAFSSSPLPAGGVKMTAYKDTAFTTKLGELTTPLVAHRWQAWSTGGLWGRKDMISTQAADGSIRFTGKFAGPGKLIAECEANDSAALKVNADGTFTLDYVARFGGNGIAYIRLMSEDAAGKRTLVRQGQYN